MATSPTRRSILITGSTSGIGLGIARRFAALGYHVAINGIEPEEEIRAIISELSAATGGETAYFRADLSDPIAARRVVEDAIIAFGQLDILINNAGIQKVAPIEDFPDADWDRVRSVLFDSNFHCIKAALPGMKQRKWGRIINIASAHGLRASPYKSAYVSAKHAVIGLTRTVALETAEHGVTANAICPGYVWTPLVERQLDDQARTHNMTREEVIRNVMLAPQPTKAFVEVEEIAELTAYLASDIARSITGSAISIDGGWTAK